MSETRDIDIPEEDSEEIPKGQRYFDNFILLLVIGLLVPFLLYNLWGMIELALVPDFVP